AANAIESPKLLLLSNLATRSGQVGCNLMDHVQSDVVAIFDRTKEPLYPYRGPQSICGIETFRDGAFRANHAAFRMTLGNDGWGRGGNPESVLNELLNDGDPAKFLIGDQLVTELTEKATRLVRLGYSTEQLPRKSNCVTVSDTERDQAGIPRPKLSYS